MLTALASGLFGAHHGPKNEPHLPFSISSHILVVVLSRKSLSIMPSLYSWLMYSSAFFASCVTEPYTTFPSESSIHCLGYALKHANIISSRNSLL